MFSSCVKTIYLPKDAKHYKDKYEKCRANRLSEVEKIEELIGDLNRCLEDGGELHDSVR